MILEGSDRVLLVNGVACALWGHGLTDPGVEHAYWGGAVLRDVMRQKGWKEGSVYLPHGAFVRDRSGEVAGMVGGGEGAAVSGGALEGPVDGPAVAAC